jgi:hypothetical protein
MIEGDISHDQMTRFLSSKAFTSKDLWGQVKATVRQIEQEDGCLIFDDTIQEKAWTDENEIMCWHFDHCKVSLRSIHVDRRAGVWHPHIFLVRIRNENKRTLATACGSLA